MMHRTTLALMTAVSILSTSDVASGPTCPPLLDYEVRPLAGGQPAKLCDAYKGKVLLVVNTASKCGFTYQYEGLERLYREYKDRGLVVLGFPSNDFGNQEPGTEAQIQEFCRLTYGVEFPMFAKTRVVEGAADPLYRALAKAAGGDYPRWNFHKYLIDREGRLVSSFSSEVEPYDRRLLGALEKLL